MKLDSIVALLPEPLPSSLEIFHPMLKKLGLMPNTAYHSIIMDICKTFPPVLYFSFALIEIVVISVDLFCPS